MEGHLPTALFKNLIPAKNGANNTPLIDAGRQPPTGHIPAESDMRLGLFLLCVYSAVLLEGDKE